MDIEKIELQDVVPDYINNVIKKSWTWGRLTQEEKKRFNAIHFDKIKGGKKQRIVTIMEIYSAFLAGVGCDSPYWRNPEPKITPLF